MGCVECCGMLLLVYIMTPFLVLADSDVLWPLPQTLDHDSTHFFNLDPNFHFKAIGFSNSLLHKAFERYEDIVKKPRPGIMKGYSIGTLSSVSVLVTNHDSHVNEQIQFGTNESYRITVDTHATISADTVFGALRGLETFSQMVYIEGTDIAIDKWTVSDWPRFPWRGLLIDTSRHWLPVDIILDILDAMSYDKLNVLHWHVVDGQSFPLQSETYPLLAQKGAYQFPEQTYSVADAKKIVEYANERGIRVLPEFDMPAHATSWGYGYPWLICNCSMYKSQCIPPKGAAHNFGDACADDPFDPTNPRTYEFLSKFLQEMADVFVDTHLHLGGDELQYRIQCWNVTRINDWMAHHGFAAGDYYGLQNYFVKQTQSISQSLPKTLVHWQELFNENMDLTKGSIVQVWKDHATLDAVVKAGFPGTLSFGWYLDHLTTSWEDMYSNEPFDGTLTPEQENLILGGEACMWGEMVDETNIRSRIWPRTSAVAERLWSAKSVDSTTLAESRLRVQRCRMVARKYPAGPLGPGWCYPPPGH